MILRFRGFFNEKKKKILVLVFFTKYFKPEIGPYGPWHFGAIITGGLAANIKRGLAPTNSRDLIPKSSFRFHLYHLLSTEQATIC